jgi:hypothetical protein
MQLQCLYMCIFVLHMLDRRAAMTTYSYCTAWQQMEEAIQMNCPDLLTEEMILLHDHSCLHMALAMSQLMVPSCWLVLPTIIQTRSLTSDVHIFELPKKESASDTLRM